MWNVNGRNWLLSFFAIVAIIIAVPGLFAPQYVFYFVEQARPLSAFGYPPLPVNLAGRLVVYAFLIGVLVCIRKNKNRYLLGTVPFVGIAVCLGCVALLAGGFGAVGLLWLAQESILLAAATGAIFYAVDHGFAKGMAILTIVVVIGAVRQMPFIHASMNSLRENRVWIEYQDTLSDMAAGTGQSIDEEIARCKAIDIDEFNLENGATRCILTLAQREENSALCHRADDESEQLDCLLDYNDAYGVQAEISGCREATTDSLKDWCLSMLLTKEYGKKDLGIVPYAELSIDDHRTVCAAISDAEKREICNEKLLRRTR